MKQIRGNKQILEVYYTANTTNAYILQCFLSGASWAQDLKNIYIYN